MSIYEKLKKRGFINEDEEGNISVKKQEYKQSENIGKNEVTPNEFMSSVTKNLFQEISDYANSNLNVLQKNIISYDKNAKGNSLWEQIINTTRNNLVNNIKSPVENSILGSKSGIFNYAKTVQETTKRNTPEYDNLLNSKFFTSKNVSEEEKTKAKMEQNPFIKQKENFIPTRLADTKNISLFNKRQILDKNNKIVPEKTETDLIKKGLQETINETDNKIQENIQNTTNPVFKKLAELSASVGNMAVGMGLNAVNPVVGGQYFYGSASGNYMEDAKQRGMNEDEQYTYGMLMGAVEAGSEMFGVGKIMKAGKALTNSALKTALKEYGVSIADNILQESVIEPIQEVVAGKIGGKDKEDWDNIGQRMLQAGVNGGLVAGITGGATLGVVSAQKIVDKVGRKEQITNSEMKTAIQDIEKAGINVTDEIKKSVEQQIKYNSNINQIGDKTAQNLISEQINNNSNLIQTAQKYNIDINNESVKSVNKALIERGIEGSFDDSIFTDNSQNAIWKTETDKDGNSIRKVILNPNASSEKTIQNITVHELTHDIEGTNTYNELKDMILKYDKKKTGYEEARKSLSESYSRIYDPNSKDFNTLVDNEAVADILGSKLGDQEFINNLTTQNRTLGQKIYDWVIDKLNKVTGYKSEKIYWTDVKNKFENAFKEEYNSGYSENKYSIAGKKGMQNLIKHDSSNIQLERTYNKAQQMQKIGIDNEKIRQETNWFQDKNGDWKFEFSDKDMSLKKDDPKSSINLPRKEDITKKQKNSINLPTKDWREHLTDNYKNTGTGETIQDIKLPIKVQNKKRELLE